ncbi:hypothetical protein CTAYLR_002987 [Chrysophaeum taylorii]|uniref:Phytanoyl-CoA dioxygenase n=1 Tax=Chrysophaeum taylorii TaxID=2483200 RepID=A0AAD7U4X2_9STRA|nr:hypothetical protein CTAYLR_002987 [Chrysophaeum taylorii]
MGLVEAWADTTPGASELFEVVRPYVQVVKKAAKGWVAVKHRAIEAPPRWRRLPTELGSLRVEGDVVQRRKEIDSVVVDESDASGLVASGEWEELYRQFARDGYVILRGLVPKRVAVETVVRLRAALKRKELIVDGRTAPKARGLTVMHGGDAIRGSDSYATDSFDCTAPSLACIREALVALACGRSIVDNELFEPVLFDPKFTWTRIKAPGEQTPEHSDYYHFVRNTGLLSGRLDDQPGLLDNDGAASPTFATVWIALEEMRAHGKGGLAMFLGSHRLDYRQEGGDGSPLPSSFFTADAGEWRVSDYMPGDAVIFDLKLIHATPKNKTADFRLSLDTRFVIQPLKAASKRPWFPYVQAATAQGLAKRFPSA